MEQLIKKFKKQGTTQLLPKLQKLQGEELEALKVVLTSRGALQEDSNLSHNEDIFKLFDSPVRRDIFTADKGEKLTSLKGIDGVYYDVEVIDHEKWLITVSTNTTLIEEKVADENTLSEIESVFVKTLIEKLTAEPGHSEEEIIDMSEYLKIPQKTVKAIIADLYSKNFVHTYIGSRKVAVVVLSTPAYKFHKDWARKSKLDYNDYFETLDKKVELKDIFIKPVSTDIELNDIVRFKPARNSQYRKLEFLEGKVIKNGNLDPKTGNRYFVIEVEGKGYFHKRQDSVTKC